MKGLVRQRILERMRAAGQTFFYVHRLVHLGGDLRESNAQKHIARMVRDGVIVRIGRGQYRLPETQSQLSHKLEGLVTTNRSYLSHRSAMAVHGLGPPLPHPTLLLTTDDARRPKVLDENTRVQMLKRKRRFLGTSVEMDVPGLGRYAVADPETTLVDGLLAPDLCGGFLEVCRFLASRRGTWNGEVLAQKARATHVAALGRRLGLLFELAGDPAAAQLAGFAPRTRVVPLWLDACGEHIGASDKRWRIRMNVSRDTLLDALGRAASAPVPPSPAPTG